MAAPKLNGFFSGARAWYDSEAYQAIVALRTASHAFQNWLELDKEVWGGDYQGHYGAGPVAFHPDGTMLACGGAALSR